MNITIAQRRRGRRLWGCALILICTGMLPLSPARAAEEVKAQIEQTREALSEWVETQRVIAKEKRDLALAKETLNQRIELVQQEIEALKGKIHNAEESIAEADKKRVELLEQNETMKTASSALAGILAELETQTKDLLNRLPESLQERVNLLSQQLPDNPDETQLSLSQRFQNVVGILNFLNKANREITVASEVRALPDGTSAEVAVLYLGVSQAYYVGANGAVAGIGHATDEGWVWEQRNEFAEPIANAIAILKNEQAASFVQLPLEIN
ncbi:DUF3450 family protein [Candidatus Sumerlaeota bacterium]|nr:DUF3450 family protein [Candidatus Sumerlaeota bacterium]